MVKRGLCVLIGLALCVALSGCATGRKQSSVEVQGLRNQISVLEEQLQAKNDEISSLKDALAKQEPIEEGFTATAKRSSKKKIIGEVKSRPNPTQIQTALSNAGFDCGAIDGRMGRQTREAIRAFQAAHGLAVDGRVGKNTWNLLREYLYKKVK